MQVTVVLGYHAPLGPRQVEPADVTPARYQLEAADRFRKAGSNEQQPERGFHGRLDPFAHFGQGRASAHHASALS